MEHIDQACAAAAEQFAALRRDHGGRADMLEAIAAALEDRCDAIIAQAHAETALHPDELRPEFARMTGTLRLFAAALREPGWARPVLEPASEQSVGPGHALTKRLLPLGPVAVFGASNFPLAYGVCGGDTASALAAGCPVVVKEHPAHPRTGRLIASVMRQVLAGLGYGPAALGYIHNEDPRDLAVASALVTHPAIRAVGFTGSLGGGFAVEKLARERLAPIPAFCEMGSTNPVIVTTAAAAGRGAEIGELLAASILSRHGQQCTCPGIMVVPMPAGQALVDALAGRMAAAPERAMLATWVRDAYVKRVDACRAASGVRVLCTSMASAAPPSHPGRHATATVLAVPGADFAAQPVLHDEIFGPAAIVVEVADDEAALALPLPNALTGSVFFQPGEAEGARRIADKLADIAGRVILNGVPTGVRVSPAMVHGGPYPASNRPDTTAVGPLAIERWCRPVCWQGEL